MVTRRLALMGTQAALFARRYRAALLDYLLGAGEVGLMRAYDLGRSALDDGIGIVQARMSDLQQAVLGTLGSGWRPLRAN